MTLRTAPASAATLCLLTLLVGCGGGADGGPTDGASDPAASEATGRGATETPSGRESSAPAEEEVVITIEEFMYSTVGPVAPGTEVTIENTDAEVHTVTADGAGGFDVTIAPGRSETLTAPGKAGDYPYLCSFHAGMTATLTVR